MAGAVLWKFVCPQNSYVEILIPKVIILGDRAFERWLGHISALIKEAPESSLSPSTM